MVITAQFCDVSGCWRGVGGTIAHVVVLLSLHRKRCLLRSEYQRLVAKVHLKRLSSHGWAPSWPKELLRLVSSGPAPGVPVFGFACARAYCRIWSLVGLLRSFAVLGFTAWLFSGLPSVLGLLVVVAGAGRFGGVAQCGMDL